MGVCKLQYTVLYGCLYLCIRRVENKQSEGKIAKPGALSLAEKRGDQQPDQASGNEPKRWQPHYRQQAEEEEIARQVQE